MMQFDVLSPFLTSGARNTYVDKRPSCMEVFNCDQNYCAKNYSIQPVTRLLT